MGHALSPGHGKAMVAAYLIGRSGRIRDAFTLGTIVTITHVASVIVLGIAALLLSVTSCPVIYIRGWEHFPGHWCLGSVT